MNRTKIEWCDYTWNPIVGCSPISTGCKNCYAEQIAARFSMPWGEAHYYPDRLNEPFSVKKPSRIFVCSMGDFFHESVPREWKEDIFQVVSSAPRHTFIFLTKRPKNIGSYWFSPPGDNVWLGVTAENQEMANRRVPELLRHPAARHFVSVEPMLSPVDLSPWLPGHGSGKKLSWVIAGPETGKNK